MFTYVTLGTNDPPRAARFYDAVLGALGLERCDVSEPEWQDWHGWGVYDKEAGRELALWLCPPFDARPASAGNGTMVALVARSWREVDRFHAAALAQGGTSEGAPGCARTTAPISTPLTCAIPTATSSRRCAGDSLSRSGIELGATRPRRRGLTEIRSANTPQGEGLWGTGTVALIHVREGLASISRLPPSRAMRARMPAIVTPISPTPRSASARAS